MATITPWKDGNKESKKVKTRGIDKIKDIYLKELNLTSISESSLETANRLFVKVIKDFKKGQLSIDELSDFGFEIFHSVAKKNKEAELFQTSLSASELSFSTRSKAAFSNVTSYLNDIEKFYQKWKEVAP